MHFHINVHIFTGNARIFMKMHKTKFSGIGLASSKGHFFERPNKHVGYRPLDKNDLVT